MSETSGISPDLVKRVGAPEIDRLEEGDFTDLEKYLEGIEKVDVMVACGKGWLADPMTQNRRLKDFEDWGKKNTDSDSSKRHSSILSAEAKLTVFTAGALMVMGKTREVICTGGNTAGIERDSEAEAMRKYMLMIFGDHIQDPNRVKIEDKAFDTVANAEGVKAMTEGKSVAAITVGYHTKRTAEVFSRVFGKQIEAHASDEFVDKIFPGNRYINKLEKHPERMLFERFREFFATALYNNEKTADLIGQLAKLKRSK